MDANADHEDGHPESSEGSALAPVATEVHLYSTPEMTVEWRPALCQHSGRCVRALPAVFAPTRRPWIIIGDTTPVALEEAVARCPSGALQFVRHHPPDDSRRSS